MLMIYYISLEIYLVW